MPDRSAMRCPHVRSSRRTTRASSSRPFRHDRRYQRVSWLWTCAVWRSGGTRSSSQALNGRTTLTSLRSVVDDCFPDQTIFPAVTEAGLDLWRRQTSTCSSLNGFRFPAVHRVVEQHMLNPKEFFRELPFPSLSYDNPRYESGGYWRGKIWPHFVYCGYALPCLCTGYHKEGRSQQRQAIEQVNQPLADGSTGGSREGGKTVRFKLT